MPKKRIEFIDLAKGFCIILVVLNHSVGAEWDGNVVLSYFRMPLYFLLSGLFFKPYGHFVNFLIRKANKLLVPYVFLYITTIVGFGYVVLYFSSLPYSLSVILGDIFSEDVRVNPAIWFLECLFFVNVLFYVLLILSRDNKIVLALLGLGMGIVGFFCPVDIPCFLDTSMTVMPFYMFGYLLKNVAAELLYPNKRDKFLPFVFLGFMLLYVLGIPEIWTGSLPQMFFKNNIYEVDVFRIYYLGVCGIMAVLSLAKWVGKLPFFSYIGRYSIIILGVHMCVIWCISKVMTKFVPSMATDSIPFLSIVFLLTLLISWAFIPLCRRFLPQFFAQKDLIPYTWDSQAKRFQKNPIQS